MFDIFVDSGANIPAVLVEKYDIEVVNFVSSFNGQSIQGFEKGLTPQEEREKGHEYYEAIRNGAVVQTSLVNSAAFSEAFEASLKEGRDVLGFTISHGISGTYNQARLAADELAEKYPERTIVIIDSLNASLAEGILAIYASEMRSEGKDISETASVIGALPPKMNGIFTVEDLKYLARTGRLSNGTAVIGNLLNIKPLLKGSKDGVIVQFRKCRGRKNSLNALIDLVCDNIIEPEKQIIGIAQADCYEESLYVMKKIQERVKVRDFINTSYDYTTGSHVGPNTIALFFIAKDRELN